jgi:deoxyadenosine/deoxycytidine kinase
MNLREKYDIPKDAVITIAGTVGVGKSTLTSKLAEALNFRTSYEQVEANPYLDKFYHDFSRWSFHLQIYLLAERFKAQKKIFEYGGGFVQDRSVYEDTGIFARMHYEKGTMTPEDYNTYKELFDAMVMTPYFPHPNLVIYLEGDLEDVVERINVRGRQMEQETPISYWEEMHERYQNWINNFNMAPVLRLSIKDYDLLNDEHAVEEIVAKVGQFMSTAAMYR